LSTTEYNIEELRKKDIMFTQILNWSFFAGLLRIATVWEGRIEDTKRIKVFLFFMTTDPLQRARDISRQIVVLSAELDRLLLAGSRPRSVSPPPFSSSYWPYPGW